VILVLTQVAVIVEMIAIRVTPLARQFTGWSAYGAMTTMMAIPFFWRSHRRLAISGLCVAVGAVIITALHSW